jgi:ubiquinone/menaquinone biosynthesis C-methylase UbiE
MSLPFNSSSLPEITRVWIERSSAAFDDTKSLPRALGRFYRILLGRYYRHYLPGANSILEVGCGDGGLLAQIDANDRVGLDPSRVQLERAQAKFPEITWVNSAGECLELSRTFDGIILSDTLNYVADAQLTLRRLAAVATPHTRLVINSHNNLWKPLLVLATWCGLQPSRPDSSWLSNTDITNLLRLAGWEVVTQTGHIGCPLPLGPLERLVNRWIMPLVPFLGLAQFTVARLRSQTMSSSVSIVVPARNEAGNIEAAITRTPPFAPSIEFIFVEGGSHDNTWEEILRVKAAYPEAKIKTLKQSGKGKGNAVRDGFAVATGDVLMILDADLTMPPEDLPKFYDAIISGDCEFANGCRLIYPMEQQAMQFLNMIANKFFGVAFSWMLGQDMKDTLCGTKVLTRANYLQIAQNRAYFGDFDPFGDFDLLFGAGRLQLKLLDIPIRYRDRTYGSTNIQRWKHGLLLFRMLAFAATKIKFFK